MKLALAQPKMMKDSISIISNLVNEAKFKITPGAVELVAMDPANVAMVIFKMTSGLFTEYDVKKETEFGINLREFKAVLNRLKPDDMFSLELVNHMLKIQLRNNTTRSFELPLLDIEEKEQKIPTLEFPVIIKIPSSIFNDAIEDVGIVTESVTFKVSPDIFALQGSGGTSHVNIEMKRDDNTKISCGKQEQVKSKYSIEYLNKMAQGSKLAEEVQIQFNEDYPLRLEYSKDERLLLGFILAPRVEND